MSLPMQEINELRQMLKNHIAGTVDNETLKARLEIYSQVEKRERIIIGGLLLAHKMGVTGLGKIIKTQLVGDGKTKPLMNIKEKQNRTPNRGS